MEIHPRINELAEEYVTNEKYPDETTRAYNFGWLENAASNWYLEALSRIPESDFENQLVDGLCAEIGFWHAVDTLHKAQKGQDVETSPYKPS